MKMKTAVSVVGFVAAMLIALYLGVEVAKGSMYIADVWDRVRNREEVEGPMLLYVYNGSTWDRATKETLKNAACEHLRTYIVGGK